MQKIRKYIANKLHNIAWFIYNNPHRELEEMQGRLRKLQKGELCHCDFAPCKHIN